ncbi:unnamed protein product [Nesidiocoris tenuis]|uniref:KOW domain-containing protein n=1 Tax=Nesidiocoris tenuis TaxID=355587 RepID=A0A6H5G4V4_9HEMI|nr:unnamed protein product [Nesidiocoris tenuis]
MKYNTLVSSSARKNRKRHFTAPSHIKRRLMSAPLSKELRQKYNVRRMPVCRGDEVAITRGHYRALNSAKITEVYRKRFFVYIEGVQREKANGVIARVGIHPSNLVICKLKLTVDRKKILARRAKPDTSDKGKFTEEMITA